jgi:UDP-N-acetyl-2-amino-2-deoxyglucuronate dehydrogenase
MTRAAVIGCGDISAVHLAAIDALDDVELVAICDTDAESRAAASSRWGVTGFESHAALLDAVRPDVVHVCTPHDQHADPVVAALEAGCDVVMEKPVAHTLDEAQRVVAAAAAHPERTIAVCLQNRYNATVQHARGLIESGSLGAVLGGSATVVWHRTPQYYAAKPWRGQRVRSGGGVLINQAIHTLDLLQWLVGDVRHVEGRCGTYALADVVDVEDTAQIVLDHASGARSVCFATLAHVADAPVTLELVTEQARLFIRGDLTVTWMDGRTEVIPERRATSVGRDYWGVSHELLVADFYRQRASAAPFWIGPAQALAAQRILAEVYALSGV